MPGVFIEKIWQSDPWGDAPAKHRRACQYRAFLPTHLAELDVKLPVEVAGLVAEADAAVRELNAAAYPALAPLARLLLRTESIASSKVEGLQMGVRELARAEARMETGGKGGATAVEIVGNIRAMELAIDEATTADTFGEEQLLAIHQRLMEHDPRLGIGGRFRTGQNWIGGNDYTPCGADFVPPPIEEVPRLLADLYTAVNDDLLPPLVQAALVHAQFETIHPFDDGNGRTGRALIHVVLRRRGVAPSYVPPVSVVLASARDRYIAGLTSFRGDDVVAWVEHFAGALHRSARLASQHIERVGNLMESWQQRLTVSSAVRSDDAAWAIIDVLPAHPIITGPVATTATARSRGSIYNAIAKLEEAGILIPLSKGKRNQAWEAVGLLDLLEELEGADDWSVGWEATSSVPRDQRGADPPTLIEVKEKDRKEVTTLRRQQAKWLVNHMASLSERIVATTYPIYQASDHRTPDALGSGLLVELGGARFVVTATHVIQKERERELRIATPLELLPIRGARVVVTREGTAGTDADDIDVTAVRVNSSDWDALPSSAFVQWGEIEHERYGNSRDSFVLTGYPVTKQRGGLKGTTLSAFAYQAMGKESRVEVYDAESRDPESTLVVGFDRRRLWDPDGLSTAPNMYGMSGSGMWRIGPNAWEAKSPPRLAAIVTEWRPKGRNPHILGTRIHLLLAALGSHYSDVREFIETRLRVAE